MRNADPQQPWLIWQLLYPQLLGLFHCLRWCGFHVGSGYLPKKRFSRPLTTSWTDPHPLFSNTGIFKNFKNEERRSAGLAAAVSPQVIGLFQGLPWSGFHIGSGHLPKKRFSRPLTTSWSDPHALVSNAGILKNF